MASVDPAVINAALVWSRAGRGEVLATGNYDFLRMRRSLTWTLLDNVWRELKPLLVAAGKTG